MKIAKLLTPSVSCLFAALLTGCATVTRGTTEALVIESEPPGAEVTLSNGLRGKTPGSFKVKRDENLIVTITKEGYEPVTVTVTSQIGTGGAVGMAGNVLLGGFVGMAVDGLSGATKELKPNPIRVKLVKLPESGKTTE